MRTAGHGSAGSVRLKGRLLFLAAVVALVASSLLAVPVRAVPPPPMVLHGHAFDAAGTPLPMGTPIRAVIDGVVYSNASQVLDSAGSYSLLVAGNWMINATTPETPTIKEGANLGETLTFAAGDFTGPTGVFRETAPWSPGASVTLDLHLGAPTGQPADIKIQGLVTRPAQGGNQYVVLCNPTANPVSLFDYYLQVDALGSYYGPNATLADALAPDATLRVNLSSTAYVDPTGDALKLVYRNPGGGGAAAGGRDIAVDRVEYNATTGGTLAWEPGNTVMGDAPAPRIGEILERSAVCSDTNSAGDFETAREPGLPPDTGTVIGITAPAAGETVSGVTTYRVRWTLSHAIFQRSVLLVWVNVTYAGASHPLVAAAAGSTEVDWSVPDLQEDAASINVTVIDPYGVTTSATVSFHIVRQQPYAILLAALLGGVVVAFIIGAFLYSRRRRAPPYPPGAPPPSAAPSPPPAAPAPLAAPDLKECPRCHTRVKAADDSCFFCGYLFVQPPPP